MAVFDSISGLICLGASACLLFASLALWWWHKHHTSYIAFVVALGVAINGIVEILIYEDIGASLTAALSFDGIYPLMRFLSAGAMFAALWYAYSCAVGVKKWRGYVLAAGIFFAFVCLYFCELLVDSRLWWVPQVTAWVAWLAVFVAMGMWSFLYFKAKSDPMPVAFGLCKQRLIMFALLTLSLIVFWVPYPAIQIASPTRLESITLNQSRDAYIIVSFIVAIAGAVVAVGCSAADEISAEEVKTIVRAANDPRAIARAALDRRILGGDSSPYNTLGRMHPSEGARMTKAEAGMYFDGLQQRTPTVYANV